MSEPNDQHLKELERITGREPAGEPLRAEGEETLLRESWLALGRLLDAANDDFDEAALLARLRIEAPEEKSASRRSRPLTRWIGLAALAASLLAAAIVWRLAIGDRDPAAITSQTASNESSSQKDPFAEQFAWDDAFDERLADAGEQLIYAAGDWRGYDAPYAAIDQRLQDLTEALGDEPL
jgi:hypothetical protein